MPNTALLFAGQGAQATGMAKGLYEGSLAAKAALDRMEALRPGLLEMMFSGAKEALDQTINTQPCVFAADMAAFYAWREAGGACGAMAGFSLGEYAALCASGALKLEDAFQLVQNRAKWMAQADEGGMTAVLGLNAPVVDAALEGMEHVWAVNYNCPGQTVIAGTPDALEGAETALKALGARTIRLPVSGAFHSPLMLEAADKLHHYISLLYIHTDYIPVYANRTARPYGDIAAELAAQTASPVLWEATVRNMLLDGVDSFVEVGPGETLSGFMKRIDRKVLIYRVSDMETLEKAVNGINSIGEVS